jgi:tetratricopeptide (TPR) repeat protein
VYFEGIDMMGHRFQHCLPPRMSICPDAEYAPERNAVLAFYVYQDEVLGRLLELARDRTVMVVSDHGFRSGADRPPDYLPYTTGQPVEWHREYGMFVLSGPGARPGGRAEGISVFDIAPTLLYLEGLPAGKDMPGKAATDALAPSDLAAFPPTRIPSYEEVGALREAPEASSSPEAQQEMVEALQALGYVGPIAGAPSAKAPPGRDGGAATEVAKTDPTSSRAAGGAGTGQPAFRTAAGSTGAAAAPTEAARVTYHRNLATYLMKAGRLPEAEQELIRADEIQPLPKTYELLSEIRASAGDIDGAIARLEEGLAAFPEMDQEAVLWIVDLNLGRARQDKAAQAFDRLRGRLTRPAIRQVCEAKILISNGKEEEAIQPLLQALAAEPALSQAALTVAPLLGARGRLTELEKPIVTALASEERLDEYQNLLGLIRLEQGRTQEALAALGRALDLSPGNARFLENHAAAALSASKPALAIDRYLKALQSPDASGSVWAGYGRVLGTAKRPAEAATAFEKALSLGEKSASTYAGYGTALLQSGRKEQARRILEKALETYPADRTLLALRHSID